MGNKDGHLQQKSSTSSSEDDLRHQTRPTGSSKVTELANILEKKALKEKNINGIPDQIFAEYVFPSYKRLGRRLFAYLKYKVKSTAPFLSVKEFTTAIECVLTTDINQIDMYMKMYSEEEQITQKHFKELVTDAYTIVENHNYNSPVRCPNVSITIQSVVNGAFLQNNKLSESQLRRWILNNCPRLTVEMHRYIICTLKTAHKRNDIMSEFQADIPVVDVDFSDKNVLLPLSEIWLLTVSLPEIFTCSSSNRDGAIQSQDADPSHWTKLYVSDYDGLGLNRFNHHVLQYGGPTVTIIHGENDDQFCIASASEWIESTQTWGTQDSMVIQMFPNFQCILRDTNNILYLNETSRGYPLGIRVGKNPNKPILSVDPDFTYVTYNMTRNGLQDIEVWGCGSDEAKEAQLDMRHRHLKDVERARKVKIDPQDWNDHPDRYLLNLAGHPTYAVETKKHTSSSEKSRTRPTSPEPASRK